MALAQHTDLTDILLIIYCFVDDFMKHVLQRIRPALQRPSHTQPPRKRCRLSVAELVSLALFRFFTGHTNWKGFYRHITTYHRADFPSLPHYKNFLRAIDELALFAELLLQWFGKVFRRLTPAAAVKVADSTPLPVCHIKRQFSHKVCQAYAAKSKGTMGWFFGFRLHIVCNELMQLLGIKLTVATTDERRALTMMWANIFGLIIADAGYVSKALTHQAAGLGKTLLTGVRANMRKLMTTTQHALLKLRQRAESVFSVLKLRLGMATTLPRSPLGYLAHYLWCLAAYQLKKFCDYLTVQRITA